MGSGNKLRERWNYVQNCSIRLLDGKDSVNWKWDKGKVELDEEKVVIGSWKMDID